MCELATILDRLGSAVKRGESAVLATVTTVKGSAYRRPGARMLLLPDGSTIGTVSGGCLEGNVKLQAWRRTAGGPSVLRYDSTSDNEIAWELGLGCKGIVDVLLERIEPERTPGYIPFLRRCLASREPGVLARVVAVDGCGPVRIGNHLAIDARGTSSRDIAEPALAEAVRIGASATLHEMRSRHVVYEFSAGRAEVFHELIRPPLPLLICGAGHDAIPLVRMARELGWHITVTDPRPSYATRERFPLADELHIADPDVAPAPSAQPGRLPLRMLGSQSAASVLEPAGAAVIMSHNYHNDLLYLRALLPAPLRYLGVLGPRDRTVSLLGNLAAEGIVASQDQTDRLYGPVGLDLGAETPEAIALAVLAEIQAVFAGRKGGFLRDRDRPIHEPCHGSAIPIRAEGNGILAACTAEGAIR